MRTAGHTVLVALKQERGDYYSVTLECSCGRVFAEKKCLKREQGAAKNLVIDEGREGANAHIAVINDALNTLGVKGACAA